MSYGIQIMPESPSPGAAIGAGVGKGLGEQIPQEVERERSARMLERLEREGGPKTPTQLYGALLRNPLLSQQPQLIPDIAQRLSERMGAQYRAGERGDQTGTGQGAETIDDYRNLQHGYSNTRPQREPGDIYNPPESKNRLENFGQYTPDYASYPDAVKDEAAQAVSSESNLKKSPDIGAYEPRSFEQKRALSDYLVRKYPDLFPRWQDAFEKVESDDEKRIQGAKERENAYGTIDTRLKDAAKDLNLYTMEGGWVNGVDESIANTFLDNAFEDYKVTGEDPTTISKNAARDLKSFHEQENRFLDTNNIYDKIRRGKDVRDNVNNLVDIYKQHGVPRSFLANRLVSQFGISPEYARARAYPLEESPEIKKYIDDLPPAIENRSETPMEDIGRYIVDNWNEFAHPDSIAVALHQKGYDGNRIKDEIRAARDRRKINVFTNDQEEGMARTNLEPNMNDLFFFSFASPDGKAPYPFVGALGRRAGMLLERGLGLDPTQLQQKRKRAGVSSDPLGALRRGFPISAPAGREEQAEGE